MTTKELMAIFDRIAVDQDKRSKEMDKLFRESRQEAKESNERMEKGFAETRRKADDSFLQIKELGKQIGGLGNKFGSFTEGMAYPSMEKILRTRFKMEVISPNVKAKRNGERALEMDIMAYSNTKVNEVYIVEVKSHLREDGITQTLEILKRFPQYFPLHKDKKLYGILAVVDVREDLKQKVYEEGLYLAVIHDEEFDIKIPNGFQPKSFQI